MMHYRPKEMEDEITETENRLFSDADLKHAPQKKNFEETGLGLKHTAKKEEKEPIKEKSGSFDDETDEPKQITFTFHPKKITKTVFAVLFLFLAVSFFYNPFYALFPWNQEKGIEGNIVADAVEKGIETQQKINEKDTAEETADSKEDADKTKESAELTTKENAEESKEETEQTEAISAQETEQIKFTIDNIKTKVTDWGGKITIVSFTIENRMKSFTPKIKAYAYDQKTQTEYKQMPIIQKFGLLQKDKKLTGTIDLSRFPFQDITADKTILLQLYDEGDAPGFAKDEKLAEILQEKVMIK